MRDSWEKYFIGIAKVVANRSTCDRASVGAVIVRSNRILATGYNGSISGDDHCNDVGHLMENNHCVRVIHAEINAIISAAKFGVSINKSIMFVTHRPCWNCYKVLSSSGIETVYYEIEYGNDYKVDTYKDRPYTSKLIKVNYE